MFSNSTIRGRDNYKTQRVGTFINISIFSSRIQVILDTPDIEPIVLVESLYCNKLNNRVEVK